MSYSLLEIILLLLLLSTVTVALFQHLRLSPILGYLSIGVLTGPYALGWLPESEETQFLGELGVLGIRTWRIIASPRRFYGRHVFRRNRISASSGN